jgi:hypothetical protein
MSKFVSEKTRSLWRRLCGYMYLLYLDLEGPLAADHLYVVRMDS